MASENVYPSILCCPFKERKDDRIAHVCVRAAQSDLTEKTEIWCSKFFKDVTSRRFEFGCGVLVSRIFSKIHEVRIIR